MFLLTQPTAKPATAIIPFRSVAAFSNSTRRDATSVAQHGSVSGLTKPRKEVPLLSEEGNKGVVQYALYAHTTLLLANPRP